MAEATKISLREVVGDGYDDFMRSRHRYDVVKGSRGSKKSTTMALRSIKRMMEYPDANMLVVRKVFRTLKDSCFTQLKWATQRLKVAHLWEFRESPLEMTYTPTGQKIYFRGLDDPLKITSITVPRGYLCWLWIEEAYEISNEADFDMLNESIRGDITQLSLFDAEEPPDAPIGRGRKLFKQTTLTFNPWNERHWLKARFFDRVSPDVFTLTTNYLCNKWLDAVDRANFEYMREHNPARYRVAGLGEWGIVEGLIYTDWVEEDFNPADIRRMSGVRAVFGLDFGYTNDPSTLFCGLIDQQTKTLYVYDEMYEKGLSNEAIYNHIQVMGYARERIVADSAEPKSIDRLRSLGMSRIVPAVKGPDSVAAGIDFLQDYHFVVHPRCVNFITELGNYSWGTDRQGKKLNVPVDDFNHLMDAMRYAVRDMLRKRRRSLLEVYK